MNALAAPLSGYKYASLLTCLQKTRDGASPVVTVQDRLFQHLLGEFRQHVVTVQEACAGNPREDCYFFFQKCSHKWHFWRCL